MFQSTFHHRHRQEIKEACYKPGCHPWLQVHWLAVDKSFGWDSGPERSAVRQRHEDAEERHRAHCVPGVHIQEGASEEVWRNANVTIAWSMSL